MARLCLRLRRMLREPPLGDEKVRLSEFEYRFNRRFDLPETILRWVYVALRTPPMPERLLELHVA